MKKPVLTCLFLTFLLMIGGCMHHPNKQTIAHSKDFSIQLTKTQFSDWLESYPVLKYQDEKQQIEAYFLQQALFNHSHILSEPMINQLDFSHLTRQYQLAYDMTKKEVYANATSNTNDVEQSFQSLLIKQKHKKPKTRLYQIYKRFPPNASQNTKDQTLLQLQNIKAQVTDLSSFKRLATLHSDAQSRLQKGLIGNVKHNQFNSELDNIIEALQKDQMSNVIPLKTGVVLFYCEKKIPVKHITDQQHRDRAFNYHKQKQALHNWNQHLKQVDQQNTPLYDWAVIRSTASDNQSIVAQTLNYHINKQQLLWLLNGIKGSKTLAQFDDEKITEVIQKHFQSHAFFEHLNKHKKQQIINDLQKNHIESITSQVLIKLVEPQLNPIQEQQIKAHYANNKDKYYLSSSYDLSVVALPLSENKIHSYQKAESLYHRITSGQLSIEQASKDHSLINDRFPTGRITRLYADKVRQLLGKEAAKQLAQMDIGQFSKVVESEHGQLLIMRINGKIDRTKASFAQSKEKIIETLKKQQVEQQQDKINSKLLSSLQIQFKRL